MRKRLRQFGRWVLGAIGLGSDAQFSYQYLWPWLIATALPVISTGCVVALSVAQNVPWQAYPILVPLTIAIAFVLFEGVLRLVPNPPFAKTATPTLPSAGVNIAGAGSIQTTAPIQVTSVNQRGGQTAATITNQGAQRRTFANVDRTGAVERLSGATAPATVTWYLGNPEAKAFALELSQTLREAGWSIAHERAAIFPDNGPVIIWANVQRQSVADLLVRELQAMGFSARRRTAEQRMAVIGIEVGGFI
ncbi:MAG: hypothetical protein WEC75_13240 [Dehalococcoidia bacterium]